MQRKQISVEQAKARLQDMCARAEHCEYELQEKMRGWGVGESQARQIIDELRSSRFVDNVRFAHAYVRDKFRFAKWGKRKIVQGLAAKRIPPEMIQDALGEIEEKDYCDCLLGILESKIRFKPELIETFEGRTKLYRFALTRGFDSAVATACIKKLFAASEL